MTLTQKNSIWFASSPIWTNTNVLLFNHAAHVLRSICMNVCVLHLGFIDQSDNVSFVSYVYFVLKKNIFLLLQMPLESEFLHQDTFVLQNFRLEIIEKYISLLNTMTQVQVTW